MSRIGKAWLLPVILALTACAHSSGLPAGAISAPQIAAAYLPLKGRIHLGLSRAVGAAMVIAPGIAVTNAHNADLVDPKSVVGTATQSDLMFFRTKAGAAPVTADPVPGTVVTAYGQGLDGELRVARGVVRERVKIKGYAAPAYFIFAADAGPGFSGGPVVDDAGRLVGITFGYKDKGGTRLMYGYSASRVLAEFSALSKPSN